MSTDEKISKDLIQTCKDGRDGFAKAADKLTDVRAHRRRRALPRVLDPARQVRDRARAARRRRYGDDADTSGSVAGKVHRGWMTLKDTLSGSDPEAVLDVAEQGEDHAKSEYEKALDADISAGLRTVVARQYSEVQQTHDIVRDLRDAYATA